MDVADALDRVIGHRGPHRYRQLCDPAHPDYREDYVALVLRLAAGLEPLPPPVPLEAAIALTVERRLCPFLSRPECGCAPDGCAAGHGHRGRVTRDDCAACLGPGGMWARLFPEAR